jgi:hypothetical protein
MSSEAAPVPELTDAMQSFPRIALFEFSDDRTDPARPVSTLTLLDAWPNAFPDGPVTLASGKRQGYETPCQLGDQLTNNSYTDDGYRFHDAFHIGIMTKLGWSPVMRSLLGVKRRATPHIDEVDDGGRSIIFEESLFDFMGMADVRYGASMEEDIDITFAALNVMKFFRMRSSRMPPRHAEITDALLSGARLFNQVRENLGGTVLANLDNRSLTFNP